MPTPRFVSWRPKAFVGPDRTNWQNRKFTYTRDGGESRKAFWVFNLEESYRPDGLTPKDFILVFYDFGEQNSSVVTCLENKIDFENTGSKQEIEREEKVLRKEYGTAYNGLETLFAGEARHPNKVIWKSNEPGAYGIGFNIRRQLTIKTIRLATVEEYGQALGVKAANVKGRNPGLDWPTTK